MREEGEMEEGEDRRGMEGRRKSEGWRERC